jgi:hypothetical protein
VYLNGIWKQRPKEKLDEVYILEAQASIVSGGSKVIEEIGKGSKGKMLPKSAGIQWNVSLVYFSTCLILV